MRLPPSVRYLPSRFQVLLNPWLWLGVLLTGVVGVYALEYHQNPGRLPWQLSSTGLGQSGDSTSTDVLLESLTPEEQAVAAELDNIELLLAQLDEDLSVLTTGGEASAAASLNASSTGVDADQADAPEVLTESSVERLNRYIDEYRFIGTRAPGSNVTPQRNEALALVQEPSETAQSPSSIAQTSALADAFARQQARSEIAVPEASTSELPGEVSLEDEIEADPSTLFFDQSGITAGSLDGLNRSFIRTTPNMSPPPGTTGYVPPASLPDFNRLNRSNGAVPTQPSAGFGSSAPTVNIPERSQVLPPAQNSVVTPLEVPGFDGSSQATPNQPRNAWEAFWD